VKGTWPTKKLGDVCQTGSGGTPLKAQGEYYDGGTIPWLLSGEVAQGEVTSAANFITKEGLEGSSAKLFPENTVLVAMYGATAGQVGILRFEAATNQAVCGILPSEDFVPEFLFYLMLSKKDELVAKAAGNAQPNISQIKIRGTDVPIVPLGEQKRIVGILDEAFDGIATAKANADRNLKNARALFESHVEFVFGQRHSGWVEQPIGECFRVRSGEFLPAKAMAQSGEFDVYGGNGIAGKHDKKNLSGENIIIGRVGAKCGNVRHLERDVWLTDNAMCISEFLKAFDYKFLTRALERKDLRKTANQAAQPVISYATIKDVLLEFPTSTMEQANIAQRLDAVERETQRLESMYQQKLALLEELKKSLLHQAFSATL
jgi:type I restriction enzyme, S subunit